MLQPVNPAGRPRGQDDPSDPFVPDLSEGAETGVYLALLELLDEGLIITGDEVILDANGAACRLLERDYRQIAGRPLVDLFPSERDFLDARARLFIHGENRGSIRLSVAAGQVKDFRFIAAARLRPGIHALILAPEYQPATRGAQTQHDALWPRLAAALAQPVIVIDDKDRISAANSAALSTLGVERDALVGQPIGVRLDVTWPVAGEQSFAEVRTETTPETILARILPGPRPGWRLLLLPPAAHVPTMGIDHLPADDQTVRADVRPDPLGPLHGGTARNDTRAMYLTSHDLLTGLPNRRLFEARFADATARARQRRCSIAVMRVDLDGFKGINREFGDDTGDAAMQQAARRIAAAVAPDGLAARERSDSFLVLLPDVDLAGEAERCAETLRLALAQPFHILGHDVTLTASVGVALYPQDGQPLNALLACARAALDHARRLGRNQVRMYHPEADRADVERHHFASGLRHAIELQQLDLHFQPLVDVRTRQVRAGEALLRWNHPKIGQLPFSRFIGAVRDGSLIAKLGDWVLHSACHHAQTWPQICGRAITLTVNVAIEQVLQGDLAASVASALARSGLPAPRLELDLDEQVFEEDSPQITATLQTLAALGVKLAIDDFGRGLSSIPRLKRHPVSAVKLHPEVVRGVGKSEHDEAIVEAIACMAAPLGLEVLARGVDNEAQQAFLSALECHLQQGPLFGPVVTAEDFRTFLLARACPP